MDPNWWLMERLGGSLPGDPTGKFSASRMQECFEQLCTLFDNDWHQQLSLQRVEPLLVIAGVQNPIGNLIRLGEILGIVGGHSSLRAEELCRLRNPREHRSVRYELEVAACFIQAGLRVELYPPLSKSQPDGVIRFSGAEVYYDAHLAEAMFPPPKHRGETKDLRDQAGRAMRKLLKKYRQLPHAGQGVLVMDSVRLLGGDDFAAMLDEVRDKLRPGQRTRVSGIILANKNIERSGFIRALPTVIARSPEAQPYLNEMAEALVRFPDWG